MELSRARGNATRLRLMLALLLTWHALPAQTSGGVAATPPPIAPAASHRVRTPSARSGSPVNDPNVILLDPAHGGTDRGGQLPGALDEADLSFAFSSRLRAALTARAFTVVVTRRSVTESPPPDARTEEAARTHAGVCLLLHATNTGRGVHLFTSSLTPATESAPPLPAETRPIVAWDTAQADLLPASTRLAGDLRDALGTARIPVTAGHASVVPLDTLHCPAVLLELAPLIASGAGEPVRRTEVSDAVYEDRVAAALAAGLEAFRTRAQGDAAAAAKAAAPVTPQATPGRPRP